MDDWISRERLNEAIEYEYDGVCVYDVSGAQAISDFQDIVDRQPAVDVAPVVHAHWIKYEPDMHGMESLACSACDYLFARLYPRNYCPNCGAKMDEEGE